MANINLDKETFQRRLQRLYNAWQKAEGENGFSKMDCLVTAVGVDDEIVYSKSGALQTWLLAYELTDTITVFTESTVLFLASKKKIDFLRQAETKDDTGTILPSRGRVCPFLTCRFRRDSNKTVGAGPRR